MTNTDDKADIDRAIALAIAELIRHGGTEEDVNHLISEFKKRTEEVTQHIEAVRIQE